jgi:hypothetical protein
MVAPRRRHDLHAPIGEQRRSPSVAPTNDPMSTVYRVASGVTGAQIDAYFSADVETDGPIPGPYSMLSFALVYAGSFDGSTYEKPTTGALAFTPSFARSPTNSNPMHWPSIASIVSG